MILDHMDMATDAMFVGTAAACSPMIENAYVQPGFDETALAQLEPLVGIPPQLWSSYCRHDQLPWCPCPDVHADVHAFVQ